MYITKNGRTVDKQKFMYEGGLKSSRLSLTETWDNRVGNRSGAGVTATLRVLTKLTPWHIEPGGSMPHSQGLQ